MIAATQSPIATTYTYDFVRTYLPPQSKAVLEIGCGAGELAAMLAADGLDLLACDSDPECVAAAKARGVAAIQATWPAEFDRTFDAVLFTRSLHHVADLERSVAAASAVLRPGGRLIVEDFRAEGAAENARLWFEDLLRSLHSSGALLDGIEPDRIIPARSDDGHCDHHLHSSFEIATALSSFGHVLREDAAYHFRYVEGLLREPSAAAELLRLELTMIEAGTIEALGQRFVVFD